MKSEAPHKAQARWLAWESPGKSFPLTGHRHQSPRRRSRVRPSRTGYRRGRVAREPMRIGVFASRPAHGGDARGQLRREGWLSQTEVVQTTRQRDRAPIWATMTIADLNTATLGTISRVGEVRGRRPRRSTPRSIRSRRRTSRDGSGCSVAPQALGISLIVESGSVSDDRDPMAASFRCPHCGTSDRVRSERVIQTHLAYTQFYCVRCDRAWAVREGDPRQSAHQTPIPTDKPGPSR